MTRKQARRRKQKKAPWFTMPKIRIGLIVAPLVAVSIVVGTYFLSASFLDRPIADPPADIKPGLTAEVTIHVQRDNDVVTVPVQSVHEHGRAVATGRP